MAATRRQLLAAKSGQAEDKTNTDDLRGTKRKRKLPPSSDGDDSNGDERVKKNSLAPAQSDQDASVEESDEIQEPAVCSCPRNVMTCIGILPSLSIVNQYCDSGSESDSTLDDENSHTVLPRVDRNRKGGEEC